MGRDAQRCWAVPRQAGTPIQVSGGFAGTCPRCGFTITIARGVPGLPCCSGSRGKKRIQEFLLRGQILLPLPWGQRGGVALSGELEPALLSPSGSSCVSSESMISQVPEQLEVGGSLLLP